MTNALDELKIEAHNDKSSHSILPDDEQKAFEEKMDMYLLGSQDAPIYAAEEDESSDSRDLQSLNSDLTSQKSHMVMQQRSMPNFLQQLHVSVEQRGFGLNRDQLKVIKQQQAIKNDNKPIGNLEEI